EYETIGMFGANLEIDDLDTIARCNYLCNDLGLDTIETAVAIGLAMQAGVLPFGDRAGVLNLLPAIGRGTTVLGRVLGQGAAVTGRVLGVTNIPAVKGQALPAYDPRSLKGIGVTYATSPMGADHTAGPTARAKVDHLNPQGQVELSRRVQLNSAIYDNLGLCLFVTAAVGARPQILADLLNARYGWQWGVEDLFELSKKTILMEREFNRRAGFTPAHDRLPEFFCTEPLPETNSVFDVPQEEVEDCHNF
ncbi:MAG: aldehyde ferredoxin oxidoreductase, partial [Moorella sp. (in: Bacteria)]|nr:aldehyde ferredoxin oxidoreductase [Moorella sp. (in: firmicutes)]